LNDIHHNLFSLIFLVAIRFVSAASVFVVVIVFTAAHAIASIIFVFVIFIVVDKSGGIVFLE
jgi:hypothetical protein